MRERCRIHGVLFAISLVGVPYCPICRRDEHADIERLTRGDRELSARAHTVLVKRAERLDPSQEAR